MAYDEKQVVRVREALSDVSNVAEIKMMGGLIFTVQGHMCCGVTGDSLMVRIGPDAWEAALKSEHVVPLDIGGGRQPRAFVRVLPQGYSTAKALATWVERGLKFIETLPVKPVKKKTTKKKAKKAVKKKKRI